MSRKPRRSADTSLPGENAMPAIKESPTAPVLDLNSSDPAIQKAAMDAHQADKKARAERQSLNYEAAVACLDPDAAKAVVDSRPKFRYEIEFRHANPRIGSRRAVIVATSEKEAKAIFADKFTELNYPAPKDLGWQPTKVLGPIVVPQGV